MNIVARCVAVAVLLSITVGAAFAALPAKLKISRRSVNFGKAFFHGVGTGAPSTPQSVQVSIPTNGQPISGLVPQVTGKNSADFQITNDGCTSTLSPGASCAISLTFQPGGLGRRTANLSIGDSLSSNQAVTILVGDGIRPKKLILPTRVSFGKVQEGKSKTKNVRLSNPNPLAIGIQSISTSTSEFLQTSNCGSSLPAGGSCTIQVTFQPSIQCETPGQVVTGQLNVVHDAGSTTSNLSGIATASAQSAIFVTNFSSNAITAYPLSGTGNIAPLEIIGDAFDLDGPQGVASDSNGDILATSFFSDSVSVFRVCAAGVIPIAAIVGADTGLNGPVGITTDAAGKVYVANFGGGPTGSGSLTIYPPVKNAVGAIDEQPTATIVGPDTGLAAPTGVALDSSNHIYVANLCTGTIGQHCSEVGSITIYPPLGSNTGTIDQMPTVTIAGPDTGLDRPQSIAVDSGGRIYVPNPNGGPSAIGSIMVFAPIGSSTEALDETPIATITGSETGLSTPQFLGLDAGGNIYVSNFDGPAITVYPPVGSSTGILNSMPTQTLSGPLTNLSEPQGIAIDRTGDILVANLSGGPSSAGSVTVYAAGVTGNIPPARTIGASNTGLDFPTGIVLDNMGNILAENSVGGGTLAVFPAGSTGNMAPSAIVEGLGSPGGVALDQSGNIYATNHGDGTPGSGSILIYPAGATSSGGNVAPIATIFGANTGLSSPTGIAVDSKSGNIYVANFYGQASGTGYGMGSITIYPSIANASGLPNQAPIAILSGPSTGLDNPEGIAFDASGNLYVANVGGSLTMYPPGSQNDAAPAATTAVDLDGPIGVALDSKGTIYVVSIEHGAFTGSIEVYSGPLTNNESPSAVISGSNTLLSSPRGIAIGSFTP